MKQLGLRDIIGPVMIGPSSSHTAGACRIALMARNLLCAPPTQVSFTLYGSFAHTYRGHGTDRALVAGILGFQPDDTRLRTSFDEAKKRGINIRIIPDTETDAGHPNTVDIHVVDKNGNELDVRGASIGGGAAELRKIDGIDVAITGEFNNMIVHQNDSPGVLSHITSCLSNQHVNIATVSLHRSEKGGDAFTVLEIDDTVPEHTIEEILAHDAIKSVRFIPAPSAQANSDALEAALYPGDLEQQLARYNFTSGKELLDACEKHQMSIGSLFEKREHVLESLAPSDARSTDEYLDYIVEVMHEATHTPLTHPQKSMGGLIGGEAARVHNFGEQGVLSGQFQLLCQYALAVLETNASMGRIVAAPTAGSSGVMPAVLMSMRDTFHCTREQMHKALLNAAAIGYLIARNATVAGAEGGCQAEIGASSGMAASAVVELMGGSPEMCLHAASTAISNILGLVCDPIAGLVEAPCQMRNTTAAANALIAAHCALAGIKHIVPFDETVEAMYKVGKALPMELRETALGGMAACPSCKNIKPDGGCSGCH